MKVLVDTHEYGDVRYSNCRNAWLDGLPGG
jgi:hypothetical protein